jgi:poly-gamma-glutamate capsule biosynthesis protein CapA/YwtB (metallophosphatase superfamily)
MQSNEVTNTANACLLRQVIHKLNARKLAAPKFNQSNNTAALARLTHLLSKKAEKRISKQRHLTYLRQNTSHILNLHANRRAMATVHRRRRQN